MAKMNPSMLLNDSGHQTDMNPLCKAQLFFFRDNLTEFIPKPLCHTTYHFIQIHTSFVGLHTPWTHQGVPNILISNDRVLHHNMHVCVSTQILCYRVSITLLIFLHILLYHASLLNSKNPFSIF
jgi:hypothetical protein